MTATLAERHTAMPELRVTQARVITSEWVKFRSLRSTYFALAAAIVAIIGLGVLFSAVVADNLPQMDAAERARINPTGVSLRGVFLAQLIIGVLGVLVVTGEYSTGMIRASLSAAPARLPVLWAKAIVFAAVTWFICTASAFVAFFVGQALLHSQHFDTTLSAPGVLRGVMGSGLYLTVVGLLGVALGWIIRHTAGAISTLFGLLLILPLLAEALPDSWAGHINPYLPSNAGARIMAFRTEPGDLAPWTGFAWFCGYLVASMVVAAVLLSKRDA
jgi:ABC-type transport system involved in multi-copper enzyme maturation permease subunit